MREKEDGKLVEGILKLYGNPYKASLVTDVYINLSDSKWLSESYHIDMVNLNFSSTCDLITNYIIHHTKREILELTVKLLKGEIVTVCDQFSVEYELRYCPIGIDLKEVENYDE